MTAAGLILKYNPDFMGKTGEYCTPLHRRSASEIKIFIVSRELQVIFIVGLKTQDNKLIQRA